MNVTLINNLIEKFVEYSNIKINHYDLFIEKGRYLKENYETLDYFFDRLYDTANFADFVFTNNSLHKNKFESFIRDLSFPIIAFLKKDILTPILISKKGNKLVTTIFNGNEYNIKEYNSTQDLLAELHLVEEINERYKFNYGHNKDKIYDKNIFFITGFPVKPLLSNSEKEHESADNHGKESHGYDNHGHGPNYISPAKRLAKLMRIERREITYIYFFAVLVGLVNLSLPLGIQSIITLISGGMLLSSIIVLTFVIVFATGFSGYLTILQVKFVEVLQQRVFAKAAYEFAFRIPKIKLESISKEYGPELVNRFFDVINIQKSLPKFLIDLTSAGMQILFGLILLSFYHPVFVFFGVFLVAMIIVVFFLSAPKGLSSSITESKYKYKVAYWLEELARNSMTFKLAGYTNLTIEKTDIFL